MGVSVVVPSVGVSVKMGEMVGEGMLVPVSVRLLVGVGEMNTGEPASFRRAIVVNGLLE